MGGDPWRGPLGAQGIPWEGTFGSPGTTEVQFGASWGLQGPFWRCSVFPMTVFDETRANRCAIDARSCSNHRFTIFGPFFHATNQKTSFGGQSVRLPGCLQAAWRFGLGVGRFLSAAPAASPKIHGVGNPWKILGKSGGVHPRLNQKSQGLKTSWSFFVKFLKFENICIMLWH